MWPVPARFPLPLWGWVQVRGNCCSLVEEPLSKRKSRYIFRAVWLSWIILSLVSLRPCSCNPAGSTGECNVETGRCTCKDNVEGFHCERWVSLPVALFQEWEIFEQWPGVNIKEINSFSIAYADANLGFSIWIPQIQEAVPPASVLDTPQFAPMLLATASTASPPASSSVKLSLSLYLRLGCRPKHEKRLKSCSFLPVWDSKLWAGRYRIPFSEVLSYWSQWELPRLQVVCSVGVEGIRSFGLRHPLCLTYTSRF